MGLLGIKIPFTQSCSMCGDATTEMFCKRCLLTLRLLEDERCQGKSGVQEENIGSISTNSTEEIRGAKRVKMSIAVKFTTSD